MQRTLIPILATGILCGVLHAQGAPQAPVNEAQLKVRFGKAVRNHNGKLPRDEAKSGMPKVHAAFDRIDRIDRNRKGHQTFTEIAKAFQRKAP